ncbi:ribokinase [Nanchangia anserum]|uniref:Ribokinase n=1 Tax=Nanchangia anserum TaxID=2692125 RepID=A0A8I0KVG5_9ACTO|nr:ribokinase [Nanchangia anserum]MBD3688914.1 ribokinase [Nanchangia anserum]QOX81178.1 ribokinase [Nanchangia anserum]
MSAALHILDRFDPRGGLVGVVGSMNADYTVDTARLPGPGETVPGGPLRILPGGKSGNQAAQAAKVGAEVRLFGALGRDDNAVFLRRCLAEAGVDTSAIHEVPGPSGTTIITVDEAGENTIVYSAGANAALDLDWVDSIADQLRALSVLGLCLESPLDVVTACARIVHEAGGLVVLNDSPFLAQLPRELIDVSDLLLVNEHEAGQLLGLTITAETDFGDVAREMSAFGYDRSVITLGARGSVVIDSGEVVRIDPVAVSARDTTGCGDAFMGTILAGLAAGASLEEAARLGTVTSAYAATRAGAQASYGTLEEVRGYFAN